MMLTSAFNLSSELSAKAQADLVAPDECHFAAIASSLAETVSEIRHRLAAARREPVRMGQEAVERDAEIRQLSARLRGLERFGLELCLGRIDPANGSPAVYIGRQGLTDGTGARLVIDWRSPAAEPYFGATHAHPMGLAGRRRYHWSQGRITDYWDESFVSLPEAATTPNQSAALEDFSAFVASLGASRTPRMRDVLGTIAAEQDAIIRAPSGGTLVVDGGPGTGKTVVALHRAAYLIYSEARIRDHQGGVLFVGPHQPFLNYVSEVLPSLGEEGVQTCTLQHLLPEGARATTEQNPTVARLKSSTTLVAAVDAAVKFYEQPPTDTLALDTPAGTLLLTPADWAEAFNAPSAGSAHNEGRVDVWEALLDILADRRPGQRGSEQERPDELVPEDLIGPADSVGSADSVGPAQTQDTDDGANLTQDAFRHSLAMNRDLREMFGRAWPLLKYTDVVGDLWRVPAYLRLCAPSLTRDEVAALQRSTPDAWTDVDLPLLDAARHRLGDPEEERRKSRQRAVEHSERERMTAVVEDLIAADDSELLVMSMLRGADLREKLAGQEGDSGPTADALAGPFAHIVVDEAQELTDAQWSMLLHRCPSRSFTIVGDRAQARHGFTESWEERLRRVGLIRRIGPRRMTVARLGINYRTPAEIMVQARQVIRQALPNATVPQSIRHSSRPITYGPASELQQRVTEWRASHPEGTACIISDSGTSSWPDDPRVRCLSPTRSKGLEFDLVVLLEPEAFGAGAGIENAVDRYVAMTRATQELMILS